MGVISEPEKKVHFTKNGTSKKKKVADDADADAYFQYIVLVTFLGINNNPSIFLLRVMLIER